ncbi:MAG: hypothetical protein QXJ95_08620 [Ignisphaera sp.]
MSRLMLLFFILLIISLALVVTGVYIVVYRGVEIGYTTYFITIPEYSFETLMPGSYIRTEVYGIELASIKRDIFEPVNWIYRTTDLPWRNCTGAKYIGVGFASRLAAFYNGTPRLMLEIYGCRGSYCELLVSSDLISDTITVKELNRYYGKTDYKLQNSILDYEYFNITLVPIGLVIEDFGVVSDATCYFKYEVSTPVLSVKGYDPKTYLITIPTYVNTFLLQIGLALSISGLALMLASLYILIIIRTKP